MKVFLVCHVAELSWQKSGYGRAIIDTKHSDVLESFHYLQDREKMFEKKLKPRKQKSKK